MSFAGDSRLHSVHRQMDRVHWHHAQIALCQGKGQFSRPRGRMHVCLGAWLDVGSLIFCGGGLFGNFPTCLSQLQWTHTVPRLSSWYFLAVAIRHPASPLSRLTACLACLGWDAMSPQAPWVSPRKGIPGDPGRTSGGCPWGGVIPYVAPL